MVTRFQKWLTCYR